MDAEINYCRFKSLNILLTFKQFMRTNKYSSEYNRSRILNSKATCAQHLIPQLLLHIQ